MFRKYLVVLLVLLATVVMFGCTDRGTGIDDSKYQHREGFSALLQFGGGHEFADELGLSMFSNIYESPTLNFRVYVPPGYEEGTTSKAPIPILYLLAPFRGNSFYYVSHGLVDIADDLIAKGEIEPMFIVLVDGSAGYGGIWYGDNYAGGRYARIIGDKQGGDPTLGGLIDFLETFLPTPGDRGNRGVSGFELGGYGAVRIGIEYDENFGSVSAVSAPLDFDGSSGSGGFMPLFGQFITNLDVPFRQADTSYTDPLRTIIMAAGTAFTPHYWYDTIRLAFGGAYADDTTEFEDTLTLFTPEGSTNSISFHLPFNEIGDIPDTTIETIDFDSLWFYDTTVTNIDTTLDLVDTTLDFIDTTITNIDSLVIPWDTTLQFDSTFMFDSSFLFDTTLFYDTTIAVDTLYDTIGYYDSLWNMWLDNNPENLLADNPGALNATDINLMVLSDDAFGFNQQTRDFAAFLSGNLGTPVTVQEFDGYVGYDAEYGHFVYDILPELLKFHSGKFTMNQ